MRGRLAPAAVTVAMLIVPLTAASVAASVSPTPGPAKTCPAAAHKILDHCD